MTAIKYAWIYVGLVKTDSCKLATESVKIGVRGLITAIEISFQDASFAWVFQ